MNSNNTGNKPFFRSNGSTIKRMVDSGISYKPMTRASVTKPLFVFDIMVAKSIIDMLSYHGLEYRSGVHGNPITKLSVDSTNGVVTAYSGSLARYKEFTFELRTEI